MILSQSISDLAKLRTMEIEGISKYLVQCSGVLNIGARTDSGAWDCLARESFERSISLIYLTT